MNKQQRLDGVYLNIAKEISTLSYCVRAKVGSILVKDGNILSMGYNGTPHGMDNDCEEKAYMYEASDNWLHPEKTMEDWPLVDDFGRYKLVTKPHVLHGESNAILKAAKSGIAVQGSTLYSTLSPCIDCAKLIIQSGIIRVVYSELFKRDNGSIEFLSQFVKVEKYDL
jgi:dCMP deaminase